MLDLNTDYQAPSVEAPVSSYDITKVGIISTTILFSIEID